IFKSTARTSTGAFESGADHAPFGECASSFYGARRWHMSDKSGSRGEIFVVDDDPAVRDTLSMVLSAGGYQVICFADGAALLAVARSRTPAAILLDVHIPGKSGLVTLKEFHGRDTPAPFFWISAKANSAMPSSATRGCA